MKIAISAIESTPESVVDPRFGRAKLFMIYDTEKNCWETLDNQQNLQAVQGAGIQSAANIVNAGCEVLISSHCGPKAFVALGKGGVAVYSFREGTVADALNAFRNGVLEKLESADVSGHW